MKLRKYISLLALITLLIIGLQAHAGKTQRVHPLNIKETWSAYTYASVRDADGFLWIATDSALKRYDGYTTRTFIHDDNDPASIGSSLIRQLLLQRNGIVWSVGTSLSRYHPETESFTNYPVSDNAQIRAIYEDDSGAFWIAGEGFGLLRFDPQQEVVTHTFFKDSSMGYIWSIAPDRDGSGIWLATADGLFLFDIKTFAARRVPFPLDFDMGFEVLRGMVEDRMGNLWLATGNGLFSINSETQVAKRYSADRADPHALSTDFITSVMVDSHGQLWIGTDKSGVHKYRADTDDFEHFPASAFDAYRFPPGAVTDIYEDPEGSLWFSVGTYGVYRMNSNGEKFKSYRHSFDFENSLGFNNVLDLHEDRQGQIWIATDGGGLDKFDPETETFAHFRYNPNNPESLSSDSVLSIAEDSRGILWIGTWGGGLNRFDPKTGKFQHIRQPSKAVKKTGLAGDNIFRIVVDQNDRLLMGVWGKGLQIYDPADNTFELYSPLNDKDNSGIRTEFINDILPTTDGNYWIGGYQALELFSPATKTFTPAGLTITGLITDLHLDQKGMLWVATNKKLMRYDPVARVTQHFGVENGLSDERIVSIEQDDLGYLWLGTYSGLNRFDPRTKDITVFDEGDGLSGSQFNRFSHLQTRAGLLYFGGTTGFSYFNPADLPRNEYAPDVHITDIEINQKLHGRDLPSGHEQSINYLEKLVLPYHQRDVAFSFTATNLISPEKNLYRYRLLGMESDWQTVDSSRRRVRYSNLEPGHYTFQILASNNEGVWAGSAKELNLVILPAWWQTWWARIGYIILIIAVMYLFSFWRLRINRAREKELERVVDEKTFELKQANHAFIQLNSELEQRVTHRTRELSKEVEERRESEEKARYIAYHDVLTGLYNRAWLLRHLNERITRTTDDVEQFALYFIGGDRFRKVNDTYGHVYGDRLLTAAAQRLVDILPKGVHAVRLGSDEFTVVYDQVISQEQTIALAEHITTAFKEPFVVENVRMSFNVSVGFVISDKSYTEPAQVLRSANVAMQHAKERGRGVYQLFDEFILQETIETAALERDLKLALVREQFHVVYQPIIIIETGALSGFEVLLRWQHPERGLVPPDKFIPMAESLGLIFDIGLWVMAKACEQIQQWRSSLNLPLLPTLAVNLSPIQLEHTELLEKLDQIFTSSGVNRSEIKFEITESALMKHTDTVEKVLESLRRSGIEMAIDDFGTGYSSLSYLGQLPVQVLKIDKTLIAALSSASLRHATSVDTSDSAHEILRATISLAHNLKMRVVAEGIETPDQLQTLKKHGCDFGQGYLISKPLSPEDATRFLSKTMVARLDTKTSARSAKP